MARGHDQDVYHVYHNHISQFITLEDVFKNKPLSYKNLSRNGLIYLIRRPISFSSEFLTHFHYDARGHLIAMIRDDSRFYVATDSPVALYNSMGSLIKQVLHSHYTHYFE